MAVRLDEQTARAFGLSNGASGTGNRGRLCERVATKGSQAFEHIRDYCRSKGYREPVAEHRFHPRRKWRLDVAWVGIKVGLEFNGGIWVAGRHTRGAGQEKDFEKLSVAAAMGWRVMQASYRQFKSGMVFDWLDKALAE